MRFQDIEEGNADASGALKGERDVYFEENNGFVKTKIYDGDKLLSNNTLEGPCIVEDVFTSVVIPPGFKMRIGEHGEYVTP